jgi:hypothetical protein
MHMIDLLNLQGTSWFGNAIQYQGNPVEMARSASQEIEDGRLTNALTGQDGD